MSKIILSKSFINNSVKLALNEDLYPSGDITSNLIKKSSIKTFKIIANQNGIIGGIEFAKSTFNVFDKKIQFHIKKKDGPQIKKSQKIHTYNLILIFLKEESMVRNINNSKIGSKKDVTFLSK